MKIGILGAPGSNKSEFANSLADLVSEHDGKIAYVLDLYVRDLQDATRLEYGGFGSHIDDMQVVFKRREWELCHDGDTTHSITVGTVLDSAAHCFIRTEETAQDRREVGLQVERLKTIAATFGLLYTDTWDYDYAFFLRYEGEERHSVLINAVLIDLIATYRVPVFHFPSGLSNDEKAELALDTISALEEEWASTPAEQRVRRSGSPGEDERDSSESVSDVSEQGRAPDDA